jgi:hypothetical protein
MSMRAFLPRLALALMLVAAVAWAAIHRDQIDPATLDDAVETICEPSPKP